MGRHGYRLLLSTPLFGVMLFCIAVFFTGCVSSSIRFSRNGASGANVRQKVVPSNWDYRKEYAVPADKVARVAAGYLGIKYRWAGMSRSGTDCSGLICMIYYDVARARLPHSSRRQRQLGRVVSLQQAKSGDLVFFKGGVFGTVNHVGMYMGNKKFIHASTRRGVMYNSLDDDYYKKRFVDMRRIFR